MSEKIKSFREARGTRCLVLMIRKFLGDFPKKENFVIIPQMQRCINSLTSNINEKCANT